MMTNIAPPIDIPTIKLTMSGTIGDVAGDVVEFAAVVNCGVHGFKNLSHSASLLQQLFVGLSQKVSARWQVDLEVSNDANLHPHGGIQPVILHSVIVP